MIKNIDLKFLIVVLVLISFGIVVTYESFNCHGNTYAQTIMRVLGLFEECRK